MWGKGASLGRDGRRGKCQGWEIRGEKLVKCPQCVLHAWRGALWGAGRGISDNLGLKKNGNLQRDQEGSTSFSSVCSVWPEGDT